MFLFIAKQFIERLNLNWRVWSWLRLNAGGRLNTCKSNGSRRKLAFLLTSGGRVSNAWESGLWRGDNDGKLSLIPRIIGRWKCGTERPHAIGWAQVGLGSWWGKGLPSLRSLAGLRGWPATLELRHGPDSYGRQQWGILRNGGNPDAAMPREWRRPSGCKVLSVLRKGCVLIVHVIDVKYRRSTG